MSGDVLTVRGLTAGYGSLKVLRGLDLRVGAGEIVVMLGANGAGKTTTLRALSGLIRASGSVGFDGRSVERLRPDQRARLGLGHIPQGRGTFTQLTVEENLRLGAYLSYRRADAAARTWFEVFPRLAERRHQRAGSLSGGEQQMLAVARALMTGPKLLLLDEPSMGLAPLVTASLFDEIARINREFDTAMLIVEQNANLSLRIAARGYLLESGEIVGHGSSDELLNDDSIRRAYLGV